MSRETELVTELEELGYIVTLHNSVVIKDTFIKSNREYTDEDVEIIIHRLRTEVRKGGEINFNMMHYMTMDYIYETIKQEMDSNIGEIKDFDSSYMMDLCDGSDWGTNKYDTKPIKEITNHELAHWRSVLQKFESKYFIDVIYHTEYKYNFVAVFNFPYFEWQDRGELREEYEELEGNVSTFLEENGIYFG